MSIIKKSAIITGGGSGMGAATAKKLVSMGWSVTISGRTQSKLDNVISDIGQAERTFAVKSDVSVLSDVEHLINAHLERFGRLDGLVNNAGMVVAGPIETINIEDWKALMATNVEGVFHASKLAVPHLKKVQGSIVNVSSLSGLGGDWGMSPYNTSKGAVSNFTKALALELGGQGVRVNAVAPTLTDTEMASFVTENDDVMAMFRNRIPMGRAAKPEEVASAITFLLSDEASFINGVNLPVDGGVSASNGQPNFS